MTDDELKRLVDALRTDNTAIRQENAAAHAETRRHFEVSAERLERRFDTLAESVIAIHEKRASVHGRPEDGAPLRIAN